MAEGLLEQSTKYLVLRHLFLLSRYKAVARPNIG